MLGTPAGIGRNLFGSNWHNYHLSQITADEHILVIATRGRYSLRGRSGLFNSGFPRIRVSQDGRRIGLSFDKELRRTALRVAGAPRFREYMTFRIGGDDGFDALSPWELEVVVEAAAVGAPEDAAPAVFALPYRLPAEYVLGDDYALEEAGFKTPRYALFGLLRESTLSEWQQAWVDRAVDIALLAGLLVALTAIFIFQDRLARRRRLLNAIRVVFLAVVLLWLGWQKDAQLTIINIMAYGQAALVGMDWALFLLDPLIFILSVYVALSLVLWGRGVYCGWLCPFGAFQELLARLARLVRIPQLRVPEGLQERLWMIKYVIVAIIFGLAAWSMDAAVKAAEVEPFKTAIIVGFDRGWPYLAYAGALLVAGLFVERFFCRFLCPLGGALSLLGRVRLLTTLKRRPQCGNPCNLCQVTCPIGAIKSDGAIDMNECLQCLDCQAEYFDDTRCPPLVTERKQAERAVPMAAE